MDGSSGSRVVRSAGDRALRWEVRRNCALTPRQTLWCYVGVCIPCTAIALAFWGLGYGMISLFVVLEMMVLALALLGYARHAVDAETVTLDAAWLRIDVRCGDKVVRTRLHPAWARVQAMEGRDGLVDFSESGLHVRIGRHIGEAARRQMVDEIRRALACGGLPPF